MKLFSEKVKPTLTNSSLNILQVEEFEEIFFGVYEVEINKTKYPVEKISEHNGNPVVSVPVTVKGSKKHYPFVLIKGTPEIIFNENNTIDLVVDNFEEPPIVISEENTVDFPTMEENEEEFVIQEEIDNKKQILEQIKKAKKEAAYFAKKIKKQKLEEAKQEIENKKREMTSMLQDARASLVTEFLSISNKIKNEFIDENDNRFFEIKETIDNKIQDMSDSLWGSLKSDFSNFEKQFDSKIKELVKELYESLQPKIDKELTNIATEIVEKVDHIEKNIENKLDNELKKKADKNLIENVEDELGAIAKANIELNDKINKGVNKALSRVGNLDKRVDDLTIAISEEVNTRINEAESYIKDFYKEKIELLEGKTFDLNEKTRKYFIELITESRNNLIDEIRKIKDEKPIEYIVESRGKKQSINSDDLIKDFDKKINSKIDNEVTRLRKYIAVYSGGGSVAQQFADGGTMNGNLTVVGSISASQYLGIGSSTTSLGSVSSLQFIPLTASPTYEEGKIFYDKNESTLTVYSDNPNTSLQVGKELWVRVVNKTDSIITDGTVVYLSGAQGSRPKAWPAIASNEEAAHKVIGVATENIAINAEGHVTVFGTVNGINMSSYNDGDVLYVSPTIPGALTNIRPPAPYHSIKVGNVTRNQHNGSLLVSVETGSDLKYLHDVLITNPQNGQTLVYNSLSGIWENKDLNYLSLSGGELSGALTITDTTAAGSGSLAEAALKINQTWNTTGTPTAIKLNVTDTASNERSLLMDLQVGGNSKFKVDKDGSPTMFGVKFHNRYDTGYFISTANGTYYPMSVDGSTGTLYMISNGAIAWDAIGWPTSNQIGVALYQDSAGVLAQRNSTNPQTFRLYNTYTNASNYERGFLRWNSNVLQIGTESAGTGSTRNISFLGGNVGIGTNVLPSKLTINSGYAQTAFEVYNFNIPSFTIINNGGEGNSFVSNGVFTLWGSAQVISSSFGVYSLPFADTFRFSSSTFNEGAKLQLMTSHGSNISGQLSLEFLSNKGGQSFTTIGSINAAIRNNLDNTLKFFIAESITEQGSSSNLREIVRFDGSNGNVGIGTTSPTSKLTIADTWNDSLSTFTAIKLNVTDTSSIMGSFLMDLQVGGSSKFKVDKIGTVYSEFGYSFLMNNDPIIKPYPSSWGVAIGETNNIALFTRNEWKMVLRSDGTLAWSGNSITDNYSGDLKLVRDSAGILAQRNETNPQTFRLYNTYTNASNYERGFLRWNSNVLEIGTEAAGTGSVRDLALNSSTFIRTNNTLIVGSGGYNQDGEIRAFRLRLSSDTGYCTASIETSGGYNNNMIYAGKNHQFEIRCGAYGSGVALRINDDFNVGIGTTNPTSKLQVKDGDIEVETIASGVILKSPNGTRFRVTIDDTGALITTAL